MITEAAQTEHDLGFQLHLNGQISEAEPYYRRAVALAPEFKEAWMNLGLAVLLQKRPEEALLYQRAALRLDPESADAQNNLGLVHYAEGHVAEAENCFRAALRLRPDHPNATLNLGTVRQILNHVEEAEALFRRALTLGADPVRAQSNLALALMEQARPDAAVVLLRDVLAQQPNANEARANLALALLSMGRLEEGFQEYECRWAVEAMSGNMPKLPQPRWTGQALHGETVVLWAEQGFGDTLQFCRYAPMVTAAGGRVILVVPKALRRVMTTLDGVAALLTEEDDVLPPFDYHCPLLSLPLAFATRVETIPAPVPYLRGDPTPWSGMLDELPGLKVGLVWAGKLRAEQPHAVAVDQRRSMRLADMAPLLDVPGCSFVSLQLGAPALQMQGVPESVLYDVSGRMTNWADTAGLMMGLDLIIAVDTAVVHLAGALGRPVWMLNRFDSCWRWLQDRDDTPWYPTLRQFRQTRPGDWAGVIDRVRVALAARVADLARESADDR